MDPRATSGAGDRALSGPRPGPPWSFPGGRRGRSMSRPSIKLGDKPPRKAAYRAAGTWDSPDGRACTIRSRPRPASTTPWCVIGTADDQQASQGRPPQAMCIGRPHGPPSRPSLDAARALDDRRADPLPATVSTHGDLGKGGEPPGRFARRVRAVTARESRHVVRESTLRRQGFAGCRVGVPSSRLLPAAGARD